MCSGVEQWCCRLTYPGSEPFMFGTVLATEERAEVALRERWASLIPYPIAPKFELLPGYMVFVERKK